MSQLTISDAQKQVDQWIQELGVRYFSELTNLAQLTEEVGELARIMSRTYGDQSFKPNSVKGKLGDELADILFVLICIANQTGVDLTTEFEKTWSRRPRGTRTAIKKNPKLQ